MRSLSFLFLFYFTFLLALGGFTKPVVAQKMDCCKNEKACHKESSNSDKNTRDCKEPICSMMFSCQLCGFIVKEAIALKPVQACLIKLPLTPYIVGDPTGYQTNNWKPPKAC